MRNRYLVILTITCIEGVKTEQMYCVENDLDSSLLKMALEEAVQEAKTKPQKEIKVKNFRYDGRMITVRWKVSSESHEINVISLGATKVAEFTGEDME